MCFIPRTQVKTMLKAMNVILKSLAIILLAISGTSLVVADNGSNPNFIIIFADDQGYNDLGC
ncbi:hypothetical protein N9B09_01620, partial [bacterium]|nr:hypothetical protein [bacterium]